MNIRGIIYKSEFIFSFSCWYRSQLEVLYPKWLKKNIFICVFLIPSLPLFLLYSIYGKYKARKINKEDLTRNYEHNLSLVAIIKNEGHYLAEYIEYYKLHGVSKFYFYDNDSTDNTKEVLKKYILQGLVEYIWWPGKIMQTKAYTDAIQRTKNNSLFVAFLDLDEFVVPVIGSLIDNIRNIVSSNIACGGVAMSWLMYGSSHHKHRPEGLVIENYVYRASEKYMLNVKTIGNPRLMHSWSSPHYPNYKYGVCNVNERGESFDIF